MKKNLFSLFSAMLVSGIVFGQNLDSANDSTPSYGTPDIGVEDVTEGTLYSNGPFYNVEGSPNASMLQDASLLMDTYGFGHANTTGYRVADDWEVTENVVVENVQVYAYQTGSTTTSTINSGSLAIWDGPPGEASSNMVWGDQFEDYFEASEWSGAYRQLESAPGATDRPIMITTLTTTGLELTPGTYWVDWDSGGTLASGPWAPPIVITGEATTGNAKQFDPTTGEWNDLVDGGISTPQGLPFEVNGEVVVAGVDEVNAMSISIYPNPTAKFINIKAGAKIENVAVYNLAGQELMKSSPKGKLAAFDVSVLPNGTYIIKAVVNGSVQSQKFVKK